MLGRVHVYYLLRDEERKVSVVHSKFLYLCIEPAAKANKSVQVIYELLNALHVYNKHSRPAYLPYL
jgi:hypothetical protein